MRVARVHHQDTERAALISPGGDSISLFGPGVETIDLITSDHPTRGAIEEVPLDQVRLLEMWGRFGRDGYPALKPGDTVTLNAQGIGMLTNRVVAGVDPIPLPEARRAEYHAEHAPA